MKTYNVITNYNPRPILHAYELEQVEFDSLEDYELDSSFVYYKGMRFNIDEFFLIGGNDYWTASCHLTNTAGVVIHLQDDCESVVLGLLT